jgi:hypothetical protein
VNGRLEYTLVRVKNYRDFLDLMASKLNVLLTLKCKSGGVVAESQITPVKKNKWGEPKYLWKSLVARNAVLIYGYVPSLIVPLQGEISRYPTEL